MTYYNTTNESGPQLAAFKQEAQTQDQAIYEVFKSGAKLIPFEVQTILSKKGIDWPVTSIRRSINTLAEEGLIENTGERRLGKYGRNNYVWQIKD